jgi:hypothetical protein
MTQDKIIEMAKQSGLINKDYDSSFLNKFTYAVENFAKLVAQHEREACAEICKKHADFYAGLEPSPIAQSAWAACVDNRDTIRARGQA